MNIQNVSKINEKNINDLRAAIEHRATWFYLLLDEARKEGLDWEGFARKAIFRCGCFHGDVKFSQHSDMKTFVNEFATDLVKKIFEMEIKEVSENRFEVHFGYCPLVNAWLKLTDNTEDIATLCDIAMDGDRGIVSAFPGFKMELGDTIAKGGCVCKLVITKE